MNLSKLYSGGIAKHIFRFDHSTGELQKNILVHRYS